MYAPAKAADKPVFNIEYLEDPFLAACRNQANWGISSMRKVGLSVCCQAGLARHACVHCTNRVWGRMRSRDGRRVMFCSQPPHVDPTGPVSWQRTEGDVPLMLRGLTDDDEVLQGGVSVGDEGWQRWYLVVGDRFQLHELPNTTV